MATEILRLFDDFRCILGVCPCCNRLFRLSDARLRYGARPVKSWFDGLELRELKTGRAEDRFQELKESMKKKALERAKVKMARIMRSFDPVFWRRGYALEDARALFDPVDFVLFDGITRRGAVRQVVLIDGKASGGERRKIQRALSKITSRRYYDWKTVRLSTEGQLLSA